MLRGLYVALVYMSFLMLGAGAPFILSLGYVWVDSFDPQEVAGAILGYLPVSLIMGVAAIGGFIVMDHKKGRVTPLTLLLSIFAIWVTFTTAVLAEYPVGAWLKWNYAFKTICFAAFVPLVFRTRVQIEAFLQIFLFAIMLHFLPVGIKTMLSGGGYGQALGILGGNSLLAEGSTLSAVALMLVPIMLYLRSNTIIMPRMMLTSLLYPALCVVAVAAAVGTFERTGLIGMAVVGGGLWLRSRRKLTFGLIALVFGAGVMFLTSDAWNQRISTIRDYNKEGSALARILVWKWTLNYTATHPFGGGFNDYVLDRIELPTANGGAPFVRNGVAFHSIYFEVLGEQGYVGLGIFAGLIGLTFRNLQRVASRAKKMADLNWARELAYALQVSLLTLLACGAFVGIAFQPMIYYLFSISACLAEHLRTAERAEAQRTVVNIEVPWGVTA